MEEREPRLMCAAGMKGVGKTYTSEKSFKPYVTGNPKLGIKGRKILIYDVNMEYTKYKAIRLEDVKKFARQSKPEIRRVLPILPNGKVARLDDLIDILEKIVENFTGGMLVLEDINRYLIDTKTSEIIGLLATNRHRDLDIIIHYQSLAALTTRMWQNTTFVRFHKQIDDIVRYRNRIPNFEMFKIAQCLVDYRYVKKGDKRFYCYVACEENYITGNFTKLDFQAACNDFFESNPKRVNEKAKSFGRGAEARLKAINVLVKEMFQKYYRGI